jgi:hypothetical protein
MADIPFFSPDDSRRILGATDFVEGLQSQGITDIDRENNLGGAWDIIYGRITAKDPEDKTGFFQLEEVGFIGDSWEAIANGKQFDGEDYDYAHHYNWEDAAINTVVKLKLVVNIDTGAEDWVFFNEVTNPAAFVFIADETGGTTRASDSEWSIIRGGSVLTNVGVLKLPSDLTMSAEGYAGVLITFIEDDGSLILASALYTSSRGEYWTADEEEGTIIINYPLATSKKIGDFTELTQLHVGDIHLEVSMPEEEEIRILGDETWIHVEKNGNTWTVSHILPGTASLKKDGFTVLDETFPCDEVAFSTLQDAQDWANSLLGAIQRISYDIRGHIYEQLECDGNVINSYDGTGDTALTSELTSSSLSSQLVPNIIDTSSGIDYTYTIKNKGANFLDFIAGGEFNTLAGKNSLGEVVGFSKGDTGGAPNLMGVKRNGPSIIESVKNVDGTSGGTYGAGTELVKLDILRFRFNDTLEVIGNVAGKAGIRKSVILNTEACLWSVATGTTVIRHYTDPNAAEFLFTAQASIANLDRAYQARLRIAANDGALLEFSVNGQGGPYNVTTLLMPLDAASNADTPSLYFNFPPGALAGDVFKMTIELVTDDANLYDANVISETFLSLSVEDECIVDGDGSNATNDNDDCITSVEIITDLPLADCSTAPARQYSSVSANTSIFMVSTFDSFSTVRAVLEDSSSTAGTSSGITFQNTDGAAGFGMSRSAQQFDLTDLGIGSQNIVNLPMTRTVTVDGPIECLVMYKEGSLPAVNNPLYDMSEGGTWTVLGKVSLPPATNDTIDLHLANIPNAADVWIGLIFLADYQNDFSDWSGVEVTANAGKGTPYDCA